MQGAFGMAGSVNQALRQISLRAWSMHSHKVAVAWAGIDQVKIGRKMSEEIFVIGNRRHDRAALEGLVGADEGHIAVFGADAGIPGRIMNQEQGR